MEIPRTVRVAAATLAPAVLSWSVAAAPHPAGDNAVPLYEQAWSEYEPARREDLTDAAENLGADDWSLTEAQRRELASDETQAFLDQIADASRLPTCDFELDYDRGPYLLMPHIGQMRASAELLIVDARRRAAVGNLGAAAERLAAAFRLAAHLCEDRVIISSLTAQGIVASADVVAARLVSGAALSEETERKLARAIRTVPANDPFDLLTALRHEGARMAAWVAASGESEQARRQFLELVEMTAGPRGEALLEDGPGALMRAIQQFGGFDAAGDGVLAMYEALLRALGSENPNRAIRAVADGVQSAEYGPVAPMFLPNGARLVRELAEGRRLAERARRRFSR